MMKAQLQIWAILLSIIAASIVGHAAQSQPLSDGALAKIIFQQRLDQQLSLELAFQDEEGKVVKLRDYFRQKPVILVLGYYECPMLCTIAYNGLIETLHEMKWSIGKEFDVLCVSINPRENFTLAAAKKRAYLKRYGRPGAAQGWHFLTGTEPAIKQLADEIGFRYAYDPISKQYAHPCGFVVATPQGKVARYFFGVSHSPKELYGSLREGSVSKIGSPIQQLFFLCFHYNPIKGQYGALIMSVMRLSGVGTVFLLAWMIVAMVRKEKTNQSST